MSQFTDQQKQYITYDKLTNTKLISGAGSGKTHTIVFRINHLVESKTFKQDEILVLVFSRMCRDDFLNRIKKYKIDCIHENNIRTIDSFAKSLIDSNNEIDVSLLSYKFMKYLQDTPIEEIKKNTKLSTIKTLFVDEAQDLNETQYTIVTLLKEKNGTLINLIGDPNQNIYQFRNSSDKYLTNFEAPTFYLTKNFRSHDPIINFSKHLRPVKNLDVDGHLGPTECIPTIVFHEDDSELETHLMGILKNAKECGIDFSDIAILSPTRGRMIGYGKSHGLCLISNLLYKNKIKFKQFYEEATDEMNSNVRYDPKKGYLNILTYMGSKGLEWKYVILIDADMCLINKRCFNEEKHKNDQYLLYVACSRAINNMIIFSKFRFNEGNLNFQLNPWFSLVPEEFYKMDTRFTKYFKFAKIKAHDMGENEKRITKILDKIDEKTLDELAQLCKYGSDVTEKSEKTITKIYDKDFSVLINSNIFLGKYVENLFFVYYTMKSKTDRKKYIDIENIIDSKYIITDVPIMVSQWFYMNREHLTWESFDKDKQNLDKLIIECVDKKFNRSQELAKHTIVTDGYFKSFILSMKENIKENYNKYLTTESTSKIKKYLFHLMVILYSLETQHYYHVLSRGKKFKKILSVCTDLFDKINEFAYTTNLNFTGNNIPVTKYGLVGEIDLLEKKDKETIIWEVKCISDITLKNILQILMYNIMYNDYDSDNLTRTININFINFLKGELITIKINMTPDELDRVKTIFIDASKHKSIL
jgi:hypothetical protein